MKLSRSHFRSRRSAFTLMEIMLVVMIIALLAGLAIFQLGDVFGTAQGAAAKANMNAYKTALLSYRGAVGTYPSSGQGLAALVTRPADGADRWRGPYMEKLDKDPWGSDYGYVCPGIKRPNAYDIFSAGPDKQLNTADDVYPD
jgi:general secretion pathway protein G